MIFEDLEIVDEHLHEFCRLYVVSRFVGPGSPWIKDRILNPFDGDRDREPESRVGPEVRAL